MQRKELVVARVDEAGRAATLSRRTLMRLAGAGALGLAITGYRGWPAAAQAPSVSKLTIDLPSEPATLDPALTYEIDGWSIVHSIYDSLVQYNPSGELEPLLAESYRLLDLLTYEFKLRPGIKFTNGEPFDAQSVVFSVQHLLDKKTASQVAQNFMVIKAVQVVDPLTVHFQLTEAAPWLPSQMAPWLAMLPPRYASNPANDFAHKPVGTGPYVFKSWQPGQQVTLDVNPAYLAVSPKGRPVAKQVVYRAVPDPSTRVADLLSGSADLIRAVPVDQVASVKSRGAEVITKAV